MVTSSQPPKPLSERQSVVLLGIIAAHVRTGSPVGSKTIVDETGLGVSAATVRNDMAALEELGFIDHPHTSAGRVPTALGYRWFVDTLHESRQNQKNIGSKTLQDESLKDEQRAALQHILSDATDLDDLLQKATGALSKITRYASLVVAPAMDRSTIKHVELVALSSEQVLAVIIADTGRVTQRMITLSAPMKEDDVSAARYAINSCVVGLCVGDAPAALAGILPAAPSQLTDLLSQVSGAISQTTNTNPQALYVRGQARLMEGQPAGEISHFKEVYETLEEQASILQILKEALSEADPVVRIGEELPIRQLAPYSVVATRYDATDMTGGHLGVLGPTRMDYGATLESVVLVADLLGEAIGAMTGTNQD